MFEEESAATLIVLGSNPTGSWILLAITTSQHLQTRSLNTELHTRTTLSDMSSHMTRTIGN